MNINLTLFAQALMFAGFIWVVATKIWPPLLNAIEERQKKIADGLAAADKAKQELADADARVADEIKKARVDAAQITDKAHQQAVQIVDKAKQDAIAEAARQKAAAEAEIANLSSKAKEVLRAQVAGLAVKGAEKILGREIDANRHRDLLDQVAGEI
ncbi:MAG TPA: F0F1 ATP synthase subunit B [Pseudomonadota bacterium]|jgi:F-type H+-transporting ATPase subunit b|nr:F0F1 ATP synthase subunit B [Pseudomonadota bacterium]